MKFSKHTLKDKNGDQQVLVIAESIYAFLPYIISKKASSNPFIQYEHTIHIVF